MEIGDKLIVRNVGETYDTYREWIVKNAKEYINSWHWEKSPTEGKEYVVVAKAPHNEYDKNLIVYAIKGDDGVFIVDGDITKPAGSRHDQPACYESNKNPYPLCVGNKSSECEDCCINENYEKFHDPYEQYHK